MKKVLDKTHYDAGRDVVEAPVIQSSAIATQKADWGETPGQIASGQAQKKPSSNANIC